MQILTLEERDSDHDNRFSFTELEETYLSVRPLKKG